MIVSKTIGAALLEGEKQLEGAGILRPRRHAELLLEKALGIDRIDLYLQSREMLTHDVQKSFESFLHRRESGEPVQHIVGWAPFYGGSFLVGTGVFIPRFETEFIVDRLLEQFHKDNYEPQVNILDLCCGCGILGITLAGEIPEAEITMVDNSPGALEFTLQNVQIRRFDDRITTKQWDSLRDPPDDWSGKFNYIVANPPYIPIDQIEYLHPDVRDGEPRDALTDGGDGMTFYRRWATTLPGILKNGGRLFVEIDVGAADAVSEILSVSFSNLTITKDLNGIERVLEGTVDD